MKEIQLTQGQVALIDDEDFDKVSQYKWHANIGGKRGLYTALTNDVAGVTSIRMHTFLMRDMPKGYSPDHIDRNPLNNRRSNLRIANQAQQVLNQGLRKDGCTPFKGVSWDKGREKYVARYTADGKYRTAGRFNSPTDAALAYDRAIIEYWSQVPDDPISGNYIQFLYLNFPEG